MMKEEQQCREQRDQREQAEGEHIENVEGEDEDEEENERTWKKIERPEKQIKLSMIDFNQCDSKKCTGRKMERFGLLKSIKEKKKKFKGVVLSAYGEKPVSMEDLELCVKNGICVIDCSWNRIDETDDFRFKHERILPYVIAGNPVNYGKPFQLSCVQALATALCAIGYTGQAEYIMSKFGWADGFWSINQHIQDYAKCSTLEELQDMSKEIEHGEEESQQRQYIMPSSSESEDEEQGE